MPTPFMCHWCDKPTMNETGICIECEQRYEEGNKDIAASIRELEIGITFYREGLQKVQDKIANDGINYVDIKEVLSITVAYLDGEPTTADEHNDAAVLAKLKYHNDDHMLQSEIEDVHNTGVIKLDDEYHAKAKINLGKVKKALENTVYMSDINKEIAKEWNRDREKNINKERIK